MFIFYDEAPIRLLVGRANNERRLALVHDSGNCPDKFVQEDGVITKPNHNHLLEVEELTQIHSQRLDEILSADPISHDQIVSLTENVGNATNASVSAEFDGIGRCIRLVRDGSIQVDILKNVSPHELEGPSVADIEAFGPEIRKTEYDKSTTAVASLM